MRFARESVPQVCVPLEVLVPVSFLHVNHVVARQFRASVQVDQGDDFGDASECGGFHRVRHAVGLERVVDLVTQRRRVVLHATLLRQNVQKL